MAVKVTAFVAVTVVVVAAVSPAPGVQVEGQVFGAKIRPNSGAGEAIAQKRSLELEEPGQSSHSRWSDERDDFKVTEEEIDDRGGEKVVRDDLTTEAAARDDSAVEREVRRRERARLVRSRVDRMRYSSVRGIRQREQHPEREQEPPSPSPNQEEANITRVSSHLRKKLTADPPHLERESPGTRAAAHKSITGGEKNDEVRTESWEHAGSLGIRAGSHTKFPTTVSHRQRDNHGDIYDSQSREMTHGDLPPRHTPLDHQSAPKSREKPKRNGVVPGGPAESNTAHGLAVDGVTISEPVFSAPLTTPGAAVRGSIAVAGRGETPTPPTAPTPKEKVTGNTEIHIDSSVFHTTPTAPSLSSHRVNAANSYLGTPAGLTFPPAATDEGKGKLYKPFTLPFAPTHQTWPVNKGTENGVTEVASNTDHDATTRGNGIAETQVDHDETHYYWEYLHDRQGSTGSGREFKTYSPEDSDSLLLPHRILASTQDIIEQASGAEKREVEEEEAPSNRQAVEGSETFDSTPGSSFSYVSFKRFPNKFPKDAGVAREEGSGEDTRREWQRGREASTPTLPSHASPFSRTTQAPLRTTTDKQERKQIARTTFPPLTTPASFRPTTDSQEREQGSRTTITPLRTTQALSRTPTRTQIKVPLSTLRTTTRTTPKTTPRTTLRTTSRTSSRTTSKTTPRSRLQSRQREDSSEDVKRDEKTRLRPVRLDDSGETKEEGRRRIGGGGGGEKKEGDILFTSFDQYLLQHGISGSRSGGQGHKKEEEEEGRRRGGPEEGIEHHQNHEILKQGHTGGLDLHNHLSHRQVKPGNNAHLRPNVPTNNRLSTRQPTNQGPPREFSANQGPPTEFSAINSPPREFIASQRLPSEFSDNQRPANQFSANHEPPREFSNNGGPPPEFFANNNPPHEFSTNQHPPREFSANSSPPREFSANSSPPREFSANQRPPREFSANGSPPPEFFSNNNPPHEFSANRKPPQEFSANDGPPHDFSPNTLPPSHFSRHQEPPRQFPSQERPPLGHERPLPSFGSHERPPRQPRPPHPSSGSHERPDQERPTRPFTRQERPPSHLNSQERPPLHFSNPERPPPPHFGTIERPNLHFDRPERPPPRFNTQERPPPQFDNLERPPHFNSLDRPSPPRFTNPLRPPHDFQNNQIKESSFRDSNGRPQFTNDHNQKRHVAQSGATANDHQQEHDHRFHPSPKPSDVISGDQIPPTTPLPPPPPPPPRPTPASFFPPLPPHPFFPHSSSHPRQKSPKRPNPSSSSSFTPFSDFLSFRPPTPIHGPSKPQFSPQKPPGPSFRSPRQHNPQSPAPAASPAPHDPLTAGSNTLDGPGSSYSVVRLEPEVVLNINPPPHHFKAVQGQPKPVRRPQGSRNQQGKRPKESRQNGGSVRDVVQQGRPQGNRAQGSRRPSQGSQRPRLPRFTIPGGPDFSATSLSLGTLRGATDHPQGHSPQFVRSRPPPLQGVRVEPQGKEAPLGHTFSSPSPSSHFHPPPPLSPPQHHPNTIQSTNPIISSPSKPIPLTVPEPHDSEVQKGFKPTEEISQPLPGGLKVRVSESHARLMRNMEYGVLGEPLDVWIPIVSRRTGELGG